MEPLAHKIDDLVERRLGSRATIYKHIRQGKLRAVKSGRSTLILPADLKNYLAALPAIDPQPPRRGRSRMKK